MRVLNFCKALEGAGNSVVLVSPGMLDSDVLEGRLRISMYRATTRGGRYAGMVRNVHRLIREFRPDVVQVTSYYAPILTFLAHLFPVPVVSDYHAAMRVMSRNMPLRVANAAAEVMTIESADATIVPTQLLATYVMRRYGKRADVVTNCVDLREFRPTESRLAVTRELGICEGTKLIFYHGSPYPENLAALRRVGVIVDKIVRKGIRTAGIVAGDFPASNDHSIILLGYKDNLATYISAADLAVLPVEIPEMGVRSRVVEYLACGLPVVTTPSGATEMEDAVRRGLVSVGKDDEELVEIASRILSLDRTESEKLRREARRFAEEYFSPARAARQLEGVYRSVIE